MTGWMATPGHGEQQQAPTTCQRSSTRRCRLAAFLSTTARQTLGSFIPDEAGIIRQYAKLGSPAALLAELERLAANETAYNQKLAWKGWKLEQMSPGWDT